jgi:zinc D-Ala-D-Ala carboxypeptidase
MQVLVSLLLLTVLVASRFGRNLKAVKKMRVTKNFTLGELVHTDTGLENVPNHAQTQNLIYLTERFLQPLRNLLGKPIIIHSGFRSRAVNNAVGGSATSDHLKGSAADFTVIGMSPGEVIRKAQDAGLPYDQLIEYNPEDNVGSPRVHVGLRQSTNRFEHKIAYRETPNSKTRYRNA